MKGGGGGGSQQKLILYWELEALQKVAIKKKLFFSCNATWDYITRVYFYFAV